LERIADCPQDIADPSRKGRIHGCKHHGTAEQEYSADDQSLLAADSIGERSQWDIQEDADHHDR